MLATGNRELQVIFTNWELRFYNTCHLSIKDMINHILTNQQCSLWLQVATEKL